MKYLKNIIRAVKREKFRFKIEPINELIEINSDKHFNYQSSGDDPYFYLVPIKKRFPKGFVKIYIKATDVYLSALFLNTKGNFNEKDKLMLPSSKNGMIIGYTRLPDNLKTLRFDPQNFPGQFYIGKTYIQELSKIETAIRIILQIIFEELEKDKLKNNIKKLLSNKKNFVSGVKEAVKKRIIYSPFDMLKNIDDKHAKTYTYINKDIAKQEYKRKLKKFIKSNLRITMPFCDRPAVSVILVLWNQCELTFMCLSSLEKHLPKDVEVIIIDNDSTDETKNLLKHIDGAKIYYNSENIGFLKACNKAVDYANGEYILFLNNDTILLPNSIEAAISCFNEEKNVGAVGAKIINLDGNLQEAGHITWSDGSCLGYGRGENPDMNKFKFRRPVDYCSGAFLMTPAELFRKLNGFDERFAPAYYEDTDYCLRIWESGHSVYYEPNAVIYHFEFGSSNVKKATDFMEKNKTLFKDKHKEYLSTRWEPKINNINRAIFGGPRRPRILIIDDWVPVPIYGAGFPRANVILNLLMKYAEVTLYTTNFNNDDANQEFYYNYISKRCELAIDNYADGLSNFMKNYCYLYDLIFVSRPHNMSNILGVLSKVNCYGHVIYDAEALYSIREWRKNNLNCDISNMQIKNGNDELNDAIKSEIALTKRADHIIVVSKGEYKIFKDILKDEEPISLLGHSIKIAPTQKPFEERKNFLMVGKFGDLNNLDVPNVDGLIWFAKEVMPYLKEYINGFKVLVIGDIEESNVVLPDEFELIGKVSVIEEYYNECRVAIIPTRFSAGVSLKAYEAASFGVPMVTTDLIASQLDWLNGVELLSESYNNPEKFAYNCYKLYSDSNIWRKIRENSLKKVSIDCSEEKFSGTLVDIVNSVLPPGQQLV
jgi:GT2 family glycosyltransferase